MPRKTAGKGSRSNNRRSKVLSPQLERAAESLPQNESLPDQDQDQESPISLDQAFGSPAAADSSRSSESSSTIHLSSDFETSAAAFAQTIGVDEVPDGGAVGDATAESEVNPSSEPILKLPAFTPETVGKFLELPFAYGASIAKDERWNLTASQREFLEGPAFAAWGSLRSTVDNVVASWLERWAQDNKEIVAFLIALAIVCGSKAWTIYGESKPAGSETVTSTMAAAA
jgi:hypothetical protein